MSNRLWMIGAVLAVTMLIGNARAEEPKQAGPKEGKSKEMKADPKAPAKKVVEVEATLRLRLDEPVPLFPNVYGFGSPYTQGPPAYGWGYAWGNPWPANWGPASVGHTMYNFQPYYEPMILPPHVHVVTLVQPPPPFVPVRPLPAVRVVVPRTIQVEIVPAK